MNSNADPLDNLDDAQAAAAFRRLVRHLRHRHDAQNIELMGLAGFCRNCLGRLDPRCGLRGRQGSGTRSDPRNAERRVEGTLPIARDA